MKAADYRGDREHFTVALRETTALMSCRVRGYSETDLSSHAGSDCRDSSRDTPLVVLIRRGPDIQDLQKTCASTFWHTAKSNKSQTNLSRPYRRVEKEGYRRKSRGPARPARDSFVRVPRVSAWRSEGPGPHWIGKHPGAELFYAGQR